MKYIIQISQSKYAKYTWLTKSQINYQKGISWITDFKTRIILWHSQSWELKNRWTFLNYCVRFIKMTNECWWSLMVVLKTYILLTSFLRYFLSLIFQNLYTRIRTPIIYLKFTQLNRIEQKQNNEQNRDKLIYKTGFFQRLSDFWIFPMRYRGIASASQRSVFSLEL